MNDTGIITDAQKFYLRIFCKEAAFETGQWIPTSFSVDRRLPEPVRDLRSQALIRSMRYCGDNDNPEGWYVKLTDEGAVLGKLLGFSEDA